VPTSVAVDLQENVQQSTHVRLLQPEVLEIRKVGGKFTVVDVLVLA